MENEMNNFEKFKGHRPFRIEIAVVIVLAIAVLLVFLFPKFDRDSKIEKETTIVFVQSMEIPLVELKKLDIPPPRPAIPVMSEDEEIDLSITLEDMIFEDYPDDVPPLPKNPDGDTRQDTFWVFDERPEPIGSIAENIVYPDIAREAGIEGTVVVQCFIDYKGVVQTCVILKGMPGTGLDEAAMDAIKKTKWKPAVQRDRNVGVWIAIPVIFKLNTR
jgi:periplasmic protein TonB